MALGVSPRIKFPSLPSLSSPEKTLSVHPSFLPTHPSAFTRCWNFHFQVTFSCGKILTLFVKGKWLIFLIVEKLISGKDVELAVLQPLWAVVRNNNRQRASNAPSGSLGFLPKNSFQVGCLMLPSVYELYEQTIDGYSTSCRICLAVLCNQNVLSSSNETTPLY